MTDRWNHNLEYHRVVLDALGPRAGRVLDVGAGEGVLVEELAPRCESAVGIDLHEPSIGRARARVTAPNVEFIVGDALTHPFEPRSFDGVVSVAALHHMDASGALARMAGLLRPGGLLVVVGLARSEFPRDIGRQLAAAATTRVLKRRHGGYWEPETPKVWPPPTTYREIASVAADVLPGVTYRRHVLWRYSLVWTKPA